MHSSPLELGRKRVELNVRESFKYFTLKLMRIYLKKKYLLFQKNALMNTLTYYSALADSTGLEL